MKEKKTSATATRLRPDLLVIGNVACGTADGGGLLYASVSENDIEVTSGCITVKGDIYAEKFNYGDSVVAVTGIVAVIGEGGGDGVR